MKELGTISDPTFVRPLRYGVLDQTLLRVLKDERDLPFAHLLLKITFTMIPLGLSLFFIHGWIWWAVAVLYFYLNNFRFKGPFGLMLHWTSHRNLFNQQFGFMNHYIPWFIGPFFGHTPETYYNHHVNMHHAENNFEEDLSSTMCFQRDSVKDFLRYFYRFFVFGLWDLFRYFKRKKRGKLGSHIVFGEYTFFLLCIVLAIINLPAALMVFIIPFVISRLIAMLGNWTQHAFVDPDMPDNPFRNSITCINVKYNHKCWNDGYHTSHHKRPHMHWTDQPEHFKKSVQEFANNGAIVFDGLDYLAIFFCLMRRDFDKLADGLVNLNQQQYSSREMAIAELKKRVQKIDVVPPYRR